MNCGEVYEDDSEKIVDGCDCGSSLFMYENEEEQRDEEELKRERSEVRPDIQEMVREGEERRENIRIEFDLDSIKVKDEGVYELNISRLLNEMPLIISKNEGVYHISLPSAFREESNEVDTDQL
jgi:predicted  nucleic acid-binding Zn-ribbon protein